MFLHTSNNQHRTKVIVQPVDEIFYMLEDNSKFITKIYNLDSTVNYVPFCRGSERTVPSRNILSQDFDYRLKNKRIIKPCRFEGRKYFK